MKKEKINLTEEEKMIKKFKKYSQIIQLAEGVIIAVLAIAVILSVITIFESDFNFNEVKKELLQFLDYDGSLSETVFLISYFSKMIAYLLLLECIGRIMTDTYKNKTPFLKQNMRRIKFLAIFALVFVGVMYFIIMLAVYELFKYGYKLQKESDETL